MNLVRTCVEVSRGFAALAVILAPPAAAQAQAPIVPRVPGSVVPGAFGSPTGGLAGFSVSVIGDLNADGRAEYIVGEPRDWFFGPGPANYATYAQGNFIVYNGNSGLPLMTALGSQGDKLGISVAGLGDLNGDGIPEFCAGAVEGWEVIPSGNPPPLVFSGNGYVQVYDGATLALRARLSQVATTSFPPFWGGAQFGRAVANLGDVDGDGINDLGVGAPNDMWDPVLSPSNDGSGVVWVYSGAALGAAVGGANVPPLTSIVAPLFPNQVEAFGTCLDGIGDLDGDNLNEIVVGAPLSGGQDGAAYMFTQMGSTLSMVDPGVTGSFEQHGSSIARAGDVDLDGDEDFLVGAPHAFGNSGQDTGRARVVSGQTGNALYDFFGDDPYIALIGLSAQPQLGYSVAGVGDLDGDGFPDFALGAPTDNFQYPDETPQALSPGQAWFDPPSAWSSPYLGQTVGTVRLMSGRTGGLLHMYSGTLAGDGLGSSIVSGGDIDGDGVNDIVIGATSGLTGPGFHEVRSGAYRFGQVYGFSNPNTTGAAATIRATGSCSINENTLTFIVEGLPGGTTGLFYYGSVMITPGTPVSNGLNWIGGTQVRTGNITVPPADPATGTATLVYTVDLTQPPFVGAPISIAAGADLAFQFYYRNAAAGPGAANLSDAISIGFLP